MAAAGSACATAPPAPATRRSIWTWRFLYALDPTLGAIDMFRVGPEGSLTALGTADAGLALFAQGLAAF